MLPSMTDYADAWLWIKLDTKGNIHDQNVIIQTGELHDLALVLTTLSGLEAWAKTVGRHGPTEGTNGWVWRARWLEIQHLAPWLSPCESGAPTARLLHVSAYPRISEEAIGWLDRLPDFVIGRDENLSTVFLNKAAHDAHDGLLIEQLTRGGTRVRRDSAPCRVACSGSRRQTPHLPTANHSGTALCRTE